MSFVNNLVSDSEHLRFVFLAQVNPLVLLGVAEANLRNSGSNLLVDVGLVVLLAFLHCAGVLEFWGSVLRVVFTFLS